MMVNKHRMEAASPSSLGAEAQPDADASNRWPALPAPDRLVQLLKRLALLFALLVVVGLPSGYFSLKYSSLIEHAELSAQVRAAKVSTLATATPELWVRQIQDMEEVLLMSPLRQVTKSRPSVMLLAFHLLSSAQRRKRQSSSARIPSMAPDE